MTELDSIEGLAKCLEHSATEPVFVFKHSTRCPISSGALGEVSGYLTTAGDSAAPVYINYVVEARPVSNAIAEALGIRHESPQIFLVSDGKAVWHTSHGAIRADALARAYREAGSRTSPDA